MKAPSRTVSAARRFAALPGIAVIVGLTALAAVFAAGSASGADPNPVHGQTLNPGETKSFTVTFTRTTAALNAYTGGQLAWSDGTYIVRSPLVIRPVPLAAPAQVSENGAPISYNVKFGYTGAFAAAGRGLVPATTNIGTVADDPGDSFSPGGPGTVSFDVTVPTGTSYARPHQAT